jgi:hypothetical protein
VPDEPTSDRPRRRPLLLAMLAAAALLVALAGSGAFAGGGASGEGSRSTPVTQGKPAADEQLRQDQGLTHRGRQCHHEGRDRPQQAPSESPPV